MLKVKLIVMGKMKEKFFADAANEYIKRLSRYCQIEVCELADLSVPDNPSKGQIEAVLIREAEAIISKIGGITNLVSLCVEGREYSSEDFSKILTDVENQGGKIAFVIGSSHGLCEKVKQMSKIKLSFSKMTFPHQLARVMLLEQIYRGFKIKNNENYHK